MDWGLGLRFFMRTFGVALVAACVVGASTANAARPPTTTVVSWFGGTESKCGDGSATVPAGDVEVTFGWGTYSNSYTTQFLDIQYVTYTINGGAQIQTAVGDKTGWRLGNGKDGSGNKTYVAQYTSPVLATLASGGSVTVTMSLKTTDTAYDNETTSYPAGTELLGTHTSCTITAA
jgi:hypothetical protein